LTIPFIIGIYNQYLKQPEDNDETVSSLFDSIVSADLDKPISIYFCDNGKGEYMLTTKTKLIEIEIKNFTTDKTSLIITLSATVKGKTLQELSDKFSWEYDRWIREKKYSWDGWQWAEFSPQEEKWIKEVFELP
jgi:hypothetical protein